MVEMVMADEEIIKKVVTEETRTEVEGAREIVQGAGETVEGAKEIVQGAREIVPGAGETVEEVVVGFRLGSYEEGDFDVVSAETCCHIPERMKELATVREQCLYVCVCVCLLNL